MQFIFTLVFPAVHPAAAHASSQLYSIHVLGAHQGKVRHWHALVAWGQCSHLLPALSRWLLFVEAGKNVLSSLKGRPQLGTGPNCKRVGMLVSVMAKLWVLIARGSFQILPEPSGRAGTSCHSRVGRIWVYNPERK